MEKFIKLKEDVNLRSLAKEMTDDRIIVLRKSQTTDTIQIKVLNKMSSKEIKQAFQPYTVVKIYNEFPYPISGNSVLGSSILKLRKIIAL